MAFSKSIWAAAALSCLGVTQAWTIDLPPCLDPFAPFVYTGCFAEGDGYNALSFRSTLSSNNMTVEECVAECKGNGYRYAGLEYYGICFCGATVDGAQLADSSCTFPCSGDSSETCGGNNELSVYQDPTFSEASGATVSDYMYLGCYTDDSSLGRTLSYQLDVDADTLTTEICLQACESAGYPFAGTEFASQCWCGVVLANDTSIVADSQCNLACNGDSSEICGGSSLLSLYIASELESLQPCGYVSSSSSSMTSTSTTSSSSSSTSSTSTTTTTSTTSTTSTTPCTTSTTSTTSSTSTTSTTSCTTSTTSTTSCTTSTTKATTTTKPTTTTKTTSSTTSLCTAVQTLPPTCEYSCGNWCFSPLPDWNDQSGCRDAYSICAASVSSCWSQAGWPGAQQCSQFQEWCSEIESYCSNECSSPGCSKTSCYQKWKPQGGSPCKTTTSVVPCTSTKTTTSTTAPASTCPPAPTNICTQPSSQQYGFGPGNPVGGIALPLVSCNDQKSQWGSSPFKLYNSQQFGNCPSYSRGDCGEACCEACEEQYEQCLDVYVKSCGSSGSGSSGSGSGQGGNGFGWKREETDLVARGESQSQAQELCEIQYQDCLQVNKNVNPGSRCQTWGTGW